MIEEYSIAAIMDTLTYANQFRGNTFLIKLGGSILHDDQLIKTLCDDLKILKNTGIKIILVHGGSKAINQYLEINNIPSEFVDGQRVTTPEAMKIIEMVLCGHVNKVLVRKLNNIGIDAIGLSGTDNNMLQCDYYSKEHGCVGTIHAVNTDPIKYLLTHQNFGFDSIPVIAPIGVDADGNAMNINADFAASHIATAMQVDKLIYITDQDGIYDKNGKVFSVLSREDLLTLIDNTTVDGGMLVKVKAILSALNTNLNHVHILNGNKPHVLIEEFFTEHGVGTLCKNMPQVTSQCPGDCHPRESGDP